MEINMKDSWEKIEEKVMEYLLGQVVKDLKDYGKMVNKKEMEYIII